MPTAAASSTFGCWYSTSSRIPISPVANHPSALNTRIRLRIVVIADCHRRAVGQNLTGSAGRAVASVIVDDANAHLAQRTPNEAKDLFRVVVEGGVRLEPAFEHPVEFEQMTG